MSWVWIQIVAIAAVASSGCFDSIVGGGCAPGYVALGGGCQRVTLVDGPGRDAGSDGNESIADGPPAPDARPYIDGGPSGPDAVSCAIPEVACPGGCADLSSDPDNCGSCGRACPSGLCVSSACVGAVAGHVVLIGHDYTRRIGANVQVLANAINLSEPVTPRVGRLVGSASVTSSANVVAALGAAQAVSPRVWVYRDVDDEVSNLGDVDVVVLMPQASDTAASTMRGQRWAAALDTFLARGGVVVSVDGVDTTSHVVLGAAGLANVAGSLDMTGAVLRVANPADAVATSVPSPYAGSQRSVAFTGSSSGVVVADELGRPVVIHTTRN